MPANLTPPQNNVSQGQLNFVEPPQPKMPEKELLNTMITFNLHQDQPTEERGEDGQVLEFVPMCPGPPELQGLHHMRGQRPKRRRLQERSKERKLLWPGFRVKSSKSRMPRKLLWPRFRVKSSKSRMPTIIEDPQTETPQSLPWGVSETVYYMTIGQNRELVPNTPHSAIPTKFLIFTHSSISYIGRNMLQNI